MQTSVFISVFGPARSQTLENALNSSSPFIASEAVRGLLRMHLLTGLDTFRPSEFPMLGITRRRFHTMRNRAFRPIAAIVSIMLLAGVPTHAAPIALSEVIQVLSNYQSPPDLRIRSVSQNSATVTSALRGSGQTSGTDDWLQIGDSTFGVSIAPAADSLLAGVAIGSDPQTIDVIAEGDVEGTVCDCGEITVPGGGFPKWPLLFLAAIPFFFINDCEDCDTPPPLTPTPTPPPIPTPEPASLLLIGTGLAAFGAGMRRRYSRERLLAQLPATREEA